MNLSNMPPYDKETHDLNVIIETPQGSRNKMKFDEEKDIFKLNKVLPAGMTFPFDFGFLPSTRGDDGDPIDVLILSDWPTTAGILVPARPIGVIEAEQEEEGKTMRNDRVVAVACASKDHENLKSLKDINPNLCKEIEMFFVNYNKVQGKEFKVLGIYGPKRAEKLIDDATRKQTKKKIGK
jgi:inorganic pyrophosphatase